MRTKLLANLFFVLVSFLYSIESNAEYGDVVLNTYAEASGMKPVIFPHWFHRIRFTCKVCHSDLGFELKAGANKIKMIDILEGQFCGECHDGETAWGSERCDLCHSGNSEMNTHVERSSLQNLLNTEIGREPKAQVE
ncbi:MAG: hypothetical protein OEY66_04955 [Gammaproteobacteria bacterium]|nr:hypothetical protein [Gammaproteobacteria bacterium]